MNINEVYYRIKRILIVILICMIVISFVGLFTLNSKFEDNIQVVDVLTEYVENRGELKLCIEK